MKIEMAVAELDMITDVLCVARSISSLRRPVVRPALPPDDQSPRCSTRQRQPAAARDRFS
jgi:hypothetical protein